MAKLNFFIYCSNFESQPSGVGNVDAKSILTTLTPNYIPSNYSFSIVFSVVDFDNTVDNALRIEFCSPTGETLVSTKEDIIITPAPEGIFPDELPNEYRGINVCLGFSNVLLKSPGEYDTKVYLNDTLIGNKKIYVIGKG